MTDRVKKSSDNLVRPNNLVRPYEQKGKKLPQYIAALSVCMGSVAAGTALGWTGNITKDKLKEELFSDITDADYGWIGSFMTLGALCMCFPIGFICDLIGRKLAMLLTIIPFSAGWLMIIFAESVDLMYAGRFLTGLAGGAFCVAAPLYTSEIAEKEVRGALGSYFQLLLTVGILFAYILGAFCKIQVVSIVCAIVPLVFGVVFFLQPETPVYNLKKNKEQAARASLRRLRGANYDVDKELKEIKEQLERDKALKITFKESFKKKATKKSLIICFGLMFFQQFSGINAVIFYVGSILTGGDSGSKKDESGLTPENATILVGVMQVAATFVASLIIDKFGRKVLLLISDCVMAISGIVLGIYYSLEASRTEEEMKDLQFLPILAVCVFIIVFSLGYGPIPWMISAELLPQEIKSNASSAAGTFNWLLAFLVTKFYGDLKNAVGPDTTFYIFGGISVLGTIFVFFMVPETKGKSLEDIQKELNGEKTVGQGFDNPGFSS